MKKTFTLAESADARHFVANHRKFAFTLAETLITLMVIGVIAALTIPNLIQTYQKQLTATKVKKFYSMINQSMKMSVVDNGDPDTWIKEIKDFSAQENKNFFDIYFLPYIQYSKIEYGCNSGRVCVFMHDNSMFEIRTDFNGTDIKYYANGERETTPKNYFAFQFNKKSTFNSKIINSKIFIEPYTYDWNGTYNQLKTGNKFSCNKQNTSFPNFCTKLLMENGWKITDDYPW